MSNLHNSTERSAVCRKSPGAQRPGVLVSLGSDWVHWWCHRSKCSHWLNFSFRRFEKPEFVCVPWMEFGSIGATLCLDILPWPTRQSDFLARFPPRQLLFYFISGCLQNHSMTSVWMSTSTGFCNILWHESLLNSNIFISHESNFVFYLDALMTRLTFGLNAPKHIHKDTKNKTITHVSVSVSCCRQNNKVMSGRCWILSAAMLRGPAGRRLRDSGQHR